MPAIDSFQSIVLDIPTLWLMAVCISTLLGTVLLITWLQQREVKALVLWAMAYLLAAGSMMLRSLPLPHFMFSTEVSGVMMLAGCGMIWNGVRLFQGRKLRLVSGFAGAAIWLAVSQLPTVGASGTARIAAGVIIAATYTFFIADELWRDRRNSVFSRAAAIIIPAAHAAVFLMPVAMRWFDPGRFANNWLTILAMETAIYGIGAAFVVLLAVKDRHLIYYRQVATTDHLTGIANRRAFLEAANKMQANQAKRGGAVTLLMFDLDHFKSVNDRFGHATGDSVLRVFATVAQSSMRASDVVGRLGGEEFAAIVPESMEDTVQIAERLRAAFEVAGLMVDNIAVGSTVSIGLATSYQAVPNIDALILRADEALYKAKHAGRNRYCCAVEEPGPRPVAVKRARGWAARRQPTTEAAATG
jgi:diguanylate cyclase (GGDEF)-like protein